MEDVEAGDKRSAVAEQAAGTAGRRLGGRSPGGTLLRPTPVEVIVELRKIIPASRGHQAHDVIGE